ncbi:hypothetical protein, partial [Faecalibaculum rodentium]|uniref:hypothetical protein n=1 Tax=Faecalibaculum rodentium TaxID=1702221 RepID=UPI003F749E7E
MILCLAIEGWQEPVSIDARSNRKRIECFTAFPISLIQQMVYQRNFKIADSFLKSNGNIVHSAASFRTCSCIAISQQPEPTCRINRDKKKPPLATAGILSSG